MIKIHDPDHVEVYIRNGCILMHTAGKRGVFDNLVKFVYKLGKNWQTRAMIHGLFSQKNLEITIDRKLY